LGALEEIMSKYFSIKNVPQDKSDPIFEIARKRLRELGESLTNAGLISEFKIAENEGLEFSFLGVDGPLKFAIYLYPGGEVFSRKINGSYETFQTAYDPEDKIGLLEELVKESESLLSADDIHEEVYEKNGNIIFRKLIYADGSSESKSTVFAGRLKRFLGSKKKVIKLK
jgi:hypothetical protein